MVFAHSVPSKWPLYKATPHPTNPLEPAPYIQFILYYIYLYIHIIACIFPAYILVSYLPLDVEKDP